MFKITDENYDFFKQIFETLWIFKATRLINVDPNIEYSPVIILSNWENKSKSVAKRGLKESLRDIMTILMDLPNDRKNELSEQLANKGLPTFNQFISTIKETPQKVIKCGKIKSLDEYYIIKEFLDDLNSEISNEYRQQLEISFHDFESNYNRKKNSS